MALMKALFISTFKTHLLKFLAVVFAFLLPIRGLILAVGLCIVVDTFMGIAKAYRIHDRITSRKLSKIISKFLLYEFAIIFFFVIDFFLLGEFIALFVGVQFLLTKVMATVLCFIELVSIDENFKIINGYSLWDKFKMMLSRGQDLKEELEELKKKKEDE